MRAWWRARQARKDQKARGGSGRDGWADTVGDVVGELIEALFKIFD